MGDLLSKVVPLSVGAAFSPTLLALLLVVLSGKRSIARAGAYVLGVLLVFAGLTFMGLAISHTTHSSPAQKEITRAVDVMAGALLLLLALGTSLRGLLHDPAAPDDAPPKPERNPGMVSAFVLGVVIMLSNFSTILLYLPAMRAISASRVEDGAKALAVVVALLITLSPVIVIYGLAALLPGPSRPVLDSLHGMIDRHARTIGIVVEVVFGVYLVIKGLP